jgi:hypothetical protein
MPTEVAYIIDIAKLASRLKKDGGEPGLAIVLDKLVEALEVAYPSEEQQ